MDYSDKHIGHCRHNSLGHCSTCENASEARRTAKLRKEALIAQVPYMDAKNRPEFQQRLQWLSEGMLRNHMEAIHNYVIDESEIAIYKQFTESR